MEISPTTTSTQRKTTAKLHKKNSSRTETLKKTQSEITSTASTTEATPTQSSSMLWPSKTSKVKFQNLSTVSPSNITYSVKGKSISLFFMNVGRNKILNKYKFGKALSWSLSMFYRHYFSRKRSKYTA